MTEKAINILGIESSCDETAAAVIRNGRDVLSNVVSTQILVHRKFGGVVPEIASRKHIEHVMPVIHKALTDAEMTLQDVDAIAVTYGPGLVGALLVGLSAAKGLALGSGKPLIGVNHLDLKPPFLALVVSGGHTSLLVVEDYNTFRLLGQTRDDAAGEAFDKIARFMGLPYPGGPEIERLARNGNPQAVEFPWPLLPGCFDFSFSGLKSAVINHIHTEEQRKSGFRREDVAASFQQAIVDVLVKKSQEALQSTGLKKIVLAGGVSANRCLQEALARGAQAVGAQLVHPTPILCTDNAVMIGVRGYYQYLHHDFAKLDLNADPSLKLGE
ncbi:tRNA (adenosine(37)-N6)-threonylcarbamoyltransferase complex transferase subunit TsaD [Acidaminococcus fermentans]|uniref:tRNA (adenosine(37)-N6)-threonylcarbamoyltransferase complex transferase subunit TsaD n=1 Tax=Acidaminococcus fermentans TaxID=905 RepID=UPI003076B07C